MNTEYNDNFLNEMLLGIPDLASLSDSNDFDTKKSVKIDNECIEVDDEELASILLEIDRMNAEERYYEEYHRECNRNISHNKQKVLETSVMAMRNNLFLRKTFVDISYSFFYCFFYFVNFIIDSNHHSIHLAVLYQTITRK